MTYTIDYDKGVLTITENGAVIFQEDFYYEPVNDRAQKVLNTIYEYTNIPKENLDTVLDEVLRFGYISVQI